MSRHYLKIFFTACITVLCLQAQSEILRDFECKNKPVVHSDKLVIRTKKMLQEDPEYLEKYIKAARTLAKAEKVVPMVTADLREKMESIKNKLNSGLEEANTSENGSVILLSSDGNIYDRSSNVVIANEVDYSWENKLTFEEYKNLILSYNEEQKKLNEIYIYNCEKLIPTRNRVVPLYEMGIE